ncbi:sugar phosphate isomerase/epimerase family protein [Marinicrinis lubricantis]|uniref:Sugar phosphate isomerase/epimerase family protein n=1 Tax=Marinicrinis lubricantis TaxID=2086470 RepID=A0ABW1IJD4_9BACL
MPNNIRFGHTAITWPNEEIDKAVPAIAACGYWGTETFGWVLEHGEQRGENLPELFQRHGLELTSMYGHLDLINPSLRQDGIDKVLNWTQLYRKFDGKIVVVGGTMLSRASFQLKEHAADVVSTLNELGARISEQGMVCCFHPHTGTAVETEEEIRRIMEAVDPSVVTFAPDVGQIAKGGSDPLSIITDYYEMIRLVHVKDYIGGPVEVDSEGGEIDPTGFLGYTPLGLGSVDLQGILQFLEETGYSHPALVELDGNQWSSTRKGTPMMAAEDAIQASKAYLEQLGYRNFKQGHSKE